MLADRGIAVLISRPFHEWRVLRAARDVPLPEWTVEFECTSWPEFSLEYILANPAVTCVLTENDERRAHGRERAHCFCARRRQTGAPAMRRTRLSVPHTRRIRRGKGRIPSPAHPPLSRRR